MVLLPLMLNDRRESLGDALAPITRGRYRWPLHRDSDAAQVTSSGILLLGLVDFCAWRPRGPDTPLPFVCS